jgi:hypothetical protein
MLMRFMFVTSRAYGERPAPGGPEAPGRKLLCSTDLAWRQTVRHFLSPERDLASLR